MEIQESLQARYRVTRLGPGVLGIRGNQNTVRRAGGIVVLRKEGLYGSFDRAQMPLNSIRENKATLLAGDKEKAMPLHPGQRFYVVAVSVSDDAVTVGLLSAGPVATADGRSADLWGSLNFFFRKETIAQARMDEISPEVDQWLVPEAFIETSASAEPAKPPATAFPPPPAGAEAATSTSTLVALQPGMARDEVVRGLGAPHREVTFGERDWLEYPDLVAVLENGKLLSVDRRAPAPVAVKVSSEPAGAEVYLDGSFVGSTATVLQLRPGTYRLAVKSPGYQDWRRDLKVLPANELNVNARLVR